MTCTSTSKGRRSQASILWAVASHIQRHGCAPSVREIATAVGSHPASVHHHLASLHQQGRLVRLDHNAPRAIGLPLTPGIVTVPVLPCACCGLSMPADHTCTSSPSTSTP